MCHKLSSLTLLAVLLERGWSPHSRRKAHTRQELARVPGVDRTTPCYMIEWHGDHQLACKASGPMMQAAIPSLSLAVHQHNRNFKAQAHTLRRAVRNSSGCDAIVR